MVAIDAGTIARAEQLCAKTNQFNLRTVRHDRAEIWTITSAARKPAASSHGLMPPGAGQVPMPVGASGVKGSRFPTRVGRHAGEIRRLLEQRDAYDVDMNRIIRQAKQRGCYLELNAHPERLDLLDIYCHIAKTEGVLVSINSDAHSINDFDNLIYGIGQARRS